MVCAKKKIAAEDYLNSLIKDPEKIEDLPDEPINQQYQRLKAKLKEYTELANNEKWEPLIPKEKSYKKGTTDSLLMAVKERLHALGDLPEDDKNSEFTDALEKAVASFQYRHGLDSDGVLGKSTFEQLNIPPSERLRTIIVNMERARWVPYQVKSKYLVVNIPAYELYVYQNDSLLWTSNVVVGKGVHQTVVFSGDVKYVVFSPYWNIPNSIVRNEILPALEKNPNYLKQHNMEITDNKGSLPTIRQKPGPSNSLGLVKFLFPNNHNIYLHDTPAKSLFNETDRAFSHGCIRVQQPVRLAEFLLEEKGDWSTERIEKAMHQGEEQTITLDQTVPVFIIYFTSFVDKDGAIHFRKDIYNRDQRLANMIMKN